jgi:hypothetical protein
MKKTRPPCGGPRVCVSQYRVWGRRRGHARALLGRGCMCVWRQEKTGAGGWDAPPDCRNAKDKSVRKFGWGGGKSFGLAVQGKRGEFSKRGACAGERGKNQKRCLAVPRAKGDAQRSALRREECFWRGGWPSPPLERNRKKRGGHCCGENSFGKRQGSACAQKRRCFLRVALSFVRVSGQC